MFILKDFKVKKEWESNSKKILKYILYVCILLEIVDYFIMKNSLLSCFSKFMIYFFGISYCILGYKKYYEVTKFKGHKFFRWIFFIAASLNCILTAVLYILEDIDISIQGISLSILILLMAITSLRNGNM